MTLLEITVKDPAYYTSGQHSVKTQPNAATTYLVDIRSIVISEHSRMPADGKYRVELPNQLSVILTEREYEAIKLVMTSIEVKGKILKIPLEANDEMAV